MTCYQDTIYFSKTFNISVFIILSCNPFVGFGSSQNYSSGLSQKRFELRFLLLSMIIILLLTIENHFLRIGHIQSTTLQYYTHRRVQILEVV